MLTADEMNLIPTTQSLNTASDRLSSRIAAKNAADQRGVNQQFAGLGRSFSGARNDALYRTNLANTGALQTGLADLQQRYEENRLGGLKTAKELGISQQLANTKAKEAADAYALGLKGLQNEFTLGKGRLDLEDYLGKQGLDLQKQVFKEDTKSKETQNLIDLFSRFAPEGAGTPFVGATSNYFNELLKKLFGHAVYQSQGNYYK